MKSRTKDTTTIGLYIEETRDQSCYHLRLYPVIIGADAYERNHPEQYPHIPSNRIRNANRTINGMRLENLQINSQGSHDDAPRSLYGWELRYFQCYAIDAHHAREMARTLTGIETRIARTAEKYGRPGTFGAYVARVAVAIGATKIVRDGSTRPGATAYDDANNQIMTIKDGTALIDRMIRTWTDAGRPAPQLQATA